MPTAGGLTTIRENQFYLGWGKQTNWGTAVAPTNYWRWLDGSDANPDARFGEEREGDASPHISLVYKTSQWWVIKVVEYVRPITIGCALQALLGSGSDTYVGPTATTTLSGSVVAGATTFSSVASLGNTSTGFFNFTPGYSSATYEVQNVNLASRSGAGPFTYNLVAGYSFANAHSSSDTVNNASTHTFTRQTGAFDAYTLETAFSPSTGKALRIQDCVCTDLTLTSEGPSKPIKAEHTWYGAPSAIQAALQTPAFEGTSIVGAAGGPLLHTMGVWTLDGSAAGSTNAATIKQFKLTLKNGGTPDELQTEGLYAPYTMPGNFDITADITLAFQNYAQYLNTYYDNPAAGTGVKDSGLVGFGSVLVNWQPASLPGAVNLPDGLNNLQVNLPNVAYKAAKLTPRLDGKPLMQALSLRASKSTAQPTPLTITLSNSQSSAY